MAAWPAIIKYAGDDELSFVGSAEAFHHHPHLRGAALSPGDVLIDAAGAVYPLQSGPLGPEIVRVPTDVLTLDAVIDLVRRHASGCGECCIGKISAPSIAAAIDLIKALESH